MDTTLQVLFTSLGGTAVGLAIATFLSRNIVTHYLSKNVENYKARLGHENEICIEKIKSDLAKADKTDDRTHEYTQVMRRYQGPLQHAAYDLQSRLFAIVTQNLISQYVSKGDDHQRDYIINNTAFVMAQYFAWTEIVRTEIQFIDFSTSERSKQFSCLQHKLYGLWRSDELLDKFRLWSGEQRAIGELMIESQSQGKTCIGYAKFLDLLEHEEHQLLTRLVADVAEFFKNPKPSFPRITKIQHTLIHLLYFLDPEYARFPVEMRSLIRNDSVLIIENEKSVAAQVCT